MRVVGLGGAESSLGWCFYILVVGVLLWVLIDCGVFGWVVGVV